MIILNFSHPLTEEQLSQIEEKTNQKITKILDIPTQLNNDQPFGEQIEKLFKSINLSSQQWQTSSILVNLPGFAPAAALVLAEIHGKIGHFPAILRLKPDPKANPPTYSVAEIINLQAVRDKARQSRYQK